MAVNLGTNRLALLTAYQDVIDEATDTDWALYTYEDDTNDLTLAASGGGGLSEITLMFDNSLVMYGFCSIKDPSAALPRYILINWVGDDVPDARKCACASHVATIADFFQGVEVIVNASCLEDIEPSAIGQRLTNGTTTVASPVLNRLKTRDDTEHPDVGTVYEKTNAEMEMKKINREEFWEKAKREEEQRKELERQKVADERRKFEEERMELERLEQENREKRYREREQEIEEHRKKLLEEEEAKERQTNHSPAIDERERTPCPQPISSQPKESHTDSQGSFLQGSDVNMEEDQSLDKKESEVEEAKAIIAQRSGNPRDFFKQKERAMTICVDTSSPVSLHRPGRLDSPFLKQQHSPSTPPPHARTHHLSDGFENHHDDDDDDDDDEGSKRSMSTVSPAAKPFSAATREEGDMWDPFPRREQTPPEPDAKPVQTVAPQIQGLTQNQNQGQSQNQDQNQIQNQGQNQGQGPFSVWESGTDSLVELWDTKPGGPAPFGSSPSGPAPSGPSPLLSFDDVMDGTFCAVTNQEQDPPMTLSYQHALQHVANREPKAEDGQLLMTNGNGDSLLKEGTQASEGYFSQSQEEEFGQSEQSSAKAPPIFYNKPPEIDITCWDTDPVDDDDD